MLRFFRAMLFALLAQAIVAVPMAASAQSKPDLARARSLILQGKGAEAWAMLEPYEFRLAGQPDYDYLLGVAAIEAGHPARATLALERVLAVNPNHAAARLDMGRAYFALGDYDRAKVELEDVLAHDPPPAARDTIERYLAAIQVRRRRAGAPRVTGYVEASIGHDSNVNAGVSQGTLFLPLFGANFTLVPSATQQDDDFRTVGGGIDVSVPIKETLSLVAGADVRQRTYLSSDTFDHLISGLHAGVQHADERDVVRFTAGMNHDELNDRSYRRLQSLNAEWRRQINRRTQFTVYGQDLRIRYPQAGTARKAPICLSSAWVAYARSTRLRAASRSATSSRARTTLPIRGSTATGGCSERGSACSVRCAATPTGMPRLACSARTIPRKTRSSR